MPERGGASETWNDLPRSLDRVAASRLLAELDSLLRAQAAAVASPDADGGVRKWFDPVARGQTLRRALGALAPATDVIGGEPTLAPPFVLAAGDGRVVVTPEGLELRDLLTRSLHGTAGPTVRLAWQDTDDADRRCYDTYRGLATRRLSSVVSLRDGTAGALLPQSVGLVLLLLLNGNVGREQGLDPPEGDEDRRAVDAAVAATVGAFADGLTPDRPRDRGPATYSLYGGYAMTEARRRLGTDLAAAPVFLASGSTDRVLARVADELRRREGVDPDRIRTAMAALGDAYERNRPVLASYGLANGRPAASSVLTSRLLDAYGATT